MKIRKYLLSQSSLIKNQLNKNHKIVKELVLPKTQNSISISKDKSNIMNETNPNKKLAEILKDENQLFVQLYSKTKKLYPTKVEETFKDLILQYQNNDYKIPDLSEKKNLFNQNPLLLIGTDLDHFYMYNDINKTNDIKSKTKLIRKHVNFIKKEMLFMEKIVNKTNELNKKSKNKMNDIDEEINYRNEKINYFLVDSVWDKIKEQKLKLKKEKKYKKEKLNILDKNNNINKSVDVLNHNNNKKYKNKEKINSYNTFYKNINSPKNSINNSKFETIQNNESTKNFNNIGIISPNFSPINKNYKNESHIIKLKQNLLNNINNKSILLKNNEENIILQREIDEIKNTLNNSNLIEKNIIFEKYSLGKNKLNNTNPIPHKKYNSLYNKTLQLSTKNNNNHLILYNNEKILNDEQKTKNSQQNIIPNIFNNISSQKENKLKNLKLFDLIKKRTLPFFALNKILKEKDPQKFMELLSKIDLKIFNRKEIEKLMRNYCEKVLGYTEKETENVINIKRNDESIYKSIQTVIKKAKLSPYKYYGKHDLKVNLDKINNSIYELKKKYISRKTGYNNE